MTLNIFGVINNSISDFVENQENKALKRGTGSYSIPFRGSIFGEIETEKVLSKLNAESVDVIWLGLLIGTAMDPFHWRRNGPTPFVP